MLDTAPLTDPIDERELVEFLAKVRKDQRYRYWTFGFPGCAVVGVALALLLFSGFFGLLAALFIDGEADIDDTPGSSVLMGVALTILLGLYIGLGAAFVRLVTAPHQGKLLFRMQRFADRNELRFSPLDANPGYPGAAFRHPNTVLRDHFSPQEGNAFDYGLAFKPSTGRNDSSLERWYLAITLDRNLPHIVLDARSNNSKIFGSNIEVYQREQALSLEGDFDRHFTLYCPTGYERDALTIFTPDLMALFIDELNAFDVEIVDNRMFVYSTKRLDFGDPEVHRRLFRIIDVVGSKTQRRTERYADENIADRRRDVVASDGRRLRQGISISGVVLAFLVGTSPFWGLIIDAVTGH